MRVLLLSCNTGEGHNSTARAIMEVLQAQEISCELQDVLACLSPRFSSFVCNWHSRIYKYAPKLSDKGYRAFERNSAEPDEYTPVYELLALGAGKLWDQICAGGYDAVICVHIFSGMMMTEVRRAWNTQIPCFFVATDYTCSPYVDHCEMDGYFIPGEELLQEFADAGLPEKRLIPTGIPVRQAFYKTAGKAEIRAALGLPDAGLIILLMCGSMGCGPIRKVARTLSQRLPEGSTVVAICGRNEKLYASMEDLASPRLRVLGYTQNVQDYMDAADMIVTKPGGLSSTEAANKHLPMVFINTVGGCEGKNFTHFLARGYAVGSKEPEEVMELVLELAKRPDRLEQMKKTLQEAFRKNSAEELTACVIAAGERYHETAYRNGKEQRGELQHGEEHHAVQETISNLARSFALETNAHGRSLTCAMLAREEGMEWVARLFEELAAEEAAHARLFLKLLRQPDRSGELPQAEVPLTGKETTEELLQEAQKAAFAREELYAAYAETACQEGNQDAVKLWQQLGRIEAQHGVFLSAVRERLFGGRFGKERPADWRCLNCGYGYRAARAADACPVCGKGVGWQENKINWRKILTDL